MSGFYKVLLLFLLVGCMRIGGEDSAESNFKTNNSLHNILKVTMGHQSAVTAADFSPDGKLFATVSVDDVVKVWDASSGLVIYDFQGFGDIWEEDHFLKFSEDSDYLLNINLSGEQVFIWDLSKGKELKPDSDYLTIDFIKGTYSISYIDTVKGDLITWGIPTKKRKFDKLSPDGKIKMVFEIEELYLIKPETQDTLWKVLYNEDSSISPCPLSDLSDAVFSPCGKYLAVVCSYSGIIVYDIENRIIFRKFWFSEYYEDEDFEYWESTHGGRKVAFSPNGELILGFDRYNTVLWEVESGKVIFRDKYSIPNVAIYSPSGDMVITAASDGYLNLYDSGNGDLKHQLCSPDGGVIFGTILENGYDVYFSKSYYYGPYVRYIWDMLQGELLIVDKTASIFDEVDSLSYQSDKYIVKGDNQNDYRVVNEDTDSDVFYFNRSIHSVFLSQYSSNPFYSISDSILVIFGTDRIEFYNFINGEKLYTLYLLEGGEYLVVDSYYRFDGSPKARELLYFVCGLDIIHKNEFKDALYVPGLASKLLKNEELPSPKLQDLEVCNKKEE